MGQTHEGTSMNMDRARFEQVMADIENLNADTRKMMLESVRVKQQTRWAPWAAISGAMAAGAALLAAGVGLAKLMM